MRLTVTPITREFAREILSWRYAPPYDSYDLVSTPETLEDDIGYFLASENRFHQIMHDGVPIAGFSMGADGQVPGGDYGADALDLGLGVRPDYTGRGLGGEIVRTVIDYAIESDAPRALRVTIAAFNTRAQRVWMREGFTEVSRFNADGSDTPFIIFIRTLG